MTFGDRIPRTRFAPSETPAQGTILQDDHPDAVELILAGHPTACPTCGSFTHLADVPTGWLCDNPACVFST